MAGKKHIDFRKLIPEESYELRQVGPDDMLVDARSLVNLVPEINSIVNLVISEKKGDFVIFEVDHETREQLVRNGVDDYKMVTNIITNVGNFLRRNNIQNVSISRRFNLAKASQVIVATIR